MGAWEPIIIQLDTSFVGDLQQGGADGQKEGKRIKAGKRETMGALVA